MIAVPRAVSWSGDHLRLLDQTRLPGAEVYIECRDVDAVFEAIRCLAVRGAPAIGVAAAWGLLLDLEALPENASQLTGLLERRGEYLVSARPTAVNLAWSVERMLNLARGSDVSSGAGLLEILREEAQAIESEDIAACEAIADAGLPLVTQHPNLLTHCNAGSLAVSYLGTALAPIYLAHSKGVPVHVFVDETRPLLQGARLTAFELQKAGVPMTLIADSMAAHVMSQGKVDAVIVGADRVAANGDVANKIGTHGLAILCRHFGLPFYVACPTSTIDLATGSGSEIPIEERNADELTSGAPAGTPAFNPAFDVTPATLVSAIITERGVIEPPFDISLANL